MVIKAVLIHGGRYLMKKTIRIWAWLMILLTIVPQASLAITIQEEEKLSREFMREINKQYDIIQDSVITNYVNHVGQKILKVVPPQLFHYHFHVINQDVYNAFAGPGGQIFINSGLFEALDSEEELAGILGHEISHVVCRHISQQIEQSRKIGIGTLAGVAAGVLLGATGSGSAAGAAIAGTMAAGQSLILAHSREDEMQADQRGVVFLTRAGYNPKGLLTSLNKIRGKQWFGKKQIPTYLMTHPAIEDRIAYLSNWIGANAATIDKIPIRPPSTFNWVHTRLIGMYGDEDMAFKKYSAEVAQNPDDLLSQYGYALALERKGDRNAAMKHFRIVLQKRAFDPMVLTDLGRSNFQDGRYAEASKILQGVLDITPEYSEALYYAGRSDIELGRYPEAVRLLTSLLRGNPDYTKALYYMGNAYGAQNNIPESCYYLGLYYRARGDNKNALMQLEKAHQLTTNAERKTEIETILKEMKKHGHDEDDAKDGSGKQKR